MESILEQAFLVEYSDCTTKYRSTRFGESGFSCPECGKPLLLFMNIDTRDFGGLLHDIPLTIIPLYYCYACRLCLGRFYYQLTENDVISSFHVLPGNGLDNPYEKTITSIPATNIQLIELTADEHAYMHTGDDAYANMCRPDILPALSRLHINHIGGYPWLYEEWESYQMTCPLCQETMCFLAKFNSTAPDGSEICGDYESPELIFAMCVTCRVIGAVHRNYC